VLDADACADLPAGTTQYDGVISGAGTLRITATHGAGTLVVTGDSTFEVERAASWFDVSQRPTGHMSVHARVDGPLSAPRIELRTTSEDLVWPVVGALSLDGHAMLADGTAVIDSLRIGLGAGEVVATSRARLAGDGLPRPTSAGAILTSARSLGPRRSCQLDRRHRRRPPHAVGSTRHHRRARPIDDVTA
jgi:autotransporter translocation and assembly factor TamB